ncbi:ABC transporter permease [Streptomyces capillispiralis]|uniref:ABC-2 type transport system permease protein n=1 Tax=Streptomyces capillispiralis TaxID=68182 RepID=A0A561TGJ1_9ACTN|nr:ABC transporter permease [Streptomyces capillispiralis]TWF86235.1 ABC-2 type transport system permease protein [Streptomyces capillispiralis]GHH91158.1 ABC transporter membrane-spanning protein [Streptomyces capillispiralis]
MSATAFAVRPAGSRHLAGTAILLRFALRRDRLMMPVWVGVNALMVLSMPNTLKGLYGTPAERADLVGQMATNSSLRAMVGPVFGDSLGALTAWRVGVYAGALAAVTALLVVVRHTRDEEESGRQELVASGMVGRRAPLTAALLAAAVASGVLALLVAVGLAGQGAGGALAFGLGLAGVGMVFATMAAIVAQLTESARLARGLTAAVLGAAFVLRAAGDSATDGGSSPLTWASPLGWLENLRAFAGERWWVLGLFAGAALLQGAVAYALAGRRDLGMSFLPSRPGPAAGRLGGAGALAWRLQRGGVLGWSVGFLLAGLVYGSLADGAAELVGDNESAREIFRRMGGRSGLTDAFLATMAGMLGLVAALFVVASVLRLHGEETSGRAEPVLAGAVGRLRWAAGHLMVAFGGSVLLMLLAGAGLALGHGERAGPVLGACLVQLPAVWVIGGVAVLLHGLVPGAAMGAWGVAGAALLIGWVGPALDVPGAVLDLSPFGHLPKLPGGSMEWPPVLILTALAAALVTAGLAGLRRRDMTT